MCASTPPSIYIYIFDVIVCFRKVLSERAITTGLSLDTLSIGGNVFQNNACTVYIVIRKVDLVSAMIMPLFFMVCMFLPFKQQQSLTVCFYTLRSD